MKPLYVFIFNLVQDVNISRAIIEFARATFDCEIMVLCTSGFFKRDITGVWAAEVAELTEKFGVAVNNIESVYDAVTHLQGKHGMIFAASESDLKAHEICHDIFLACPASFVRVTLQHGFECVGFLHNEAHDRAHGLRVGFGADVIVGWFDAELMVSTKGYERQKLFIAGPPMMLSAGAAGGRGNREAGQMRGLICENLHSVRLQAPGSKNSFLDSVAAFAEKVVEVDGVIDLRPHPGGQFTTKNKIELPASIVKNVAPLYKQDLGVFHFGISAPSSVLIDMICAGVPTAIWQDEYDSLDTSNYQGLPVVHGADEWWNFAAEAFNDPSELLRRQNAFLDKFAIPSNVPQRYRTLMSSLPM